MISLPTGLVAPPQGLSVLMKAYSTSAVVGVSSSNLQLVSSANLQLVSAANLQLVSSSNLVTQTVQISSGESSTSYNLPVSPGEYTLSYELTSSFEGLVEQGFYSSNGVTSVATERITVQSDDISNINLELSAKAKITGQIILPEGMLAPPEGMTVQMTAMGEEEVSISCIIPSGEASTDFIFYLDPGEYYIHYRMTNDLSLIKEGYINNEDQSTKYSNEAKRILLEEATTSNVALQLQRTVSLTGAVKTDGLYPLPENGLDLVVRAIGKSTFVSLLHLTEDQPQADFAFTVPEDTYKIAVVVDEAQAVYYRSGYLGSGMLTFEVDQADTLLMNANLVVGVITVPTKIINVFKTPELSMLSEVKILETPNVDEKIVANLEIIDGLEKETDVDGLDQEVQVIDSNEGIPSVVAPTTFVDNVAESADDINLDVGGLEDTEVVETETTDVDDVNELTESTEVIEESEITDNTEKTSVIDSAEASVVSDIIDNEYVEEVASFEENEIIESSVNLVEKVNETESNNQMTLMSLTPDTIAPIITKSSSYLITSLPSTISLQVTDESLLIGVWIGSHQVVVQSNGTIDFSVNDLGIGTTIYEILAADANSNSKLEKLIVEYDPNPPTSEEHSLKWDIVGPNILVNEVYIVTSSPSSISFSVTDSTKVSEITIDGKKAILSDDNTALCEINNLQPGLNELTIVATDVVGNISTKNLVVEYLKPTTIVLTIGSTTATRDGVVFIGMDQVPVVTGGRVFLPARYVLVNLMGGSMTWDPLTQSILSVVKGNTIRMFIGSKTSYINGYAVTLLEAPYIEPSTNRTVVPMREIMEAIGISLAYNPITQSITITIPQ